MPADAARPLSRYAWRSVVERHPELRTCFRSRNGLAEQRFSSVRTGLDVRDVGPISDDELQRAAMAIYGEPLDLASGRTASCCLIRRSTNDGMLLVKVHHIVGDLGTADMINEELGRAYDDVETYSLSEPAPRSYRDYVPFQRDLLASARGAAMRSHWRTMLESAPASLDLPTEKKRPSVRRNVGASHTFELLTPQYRELLERLKKEAGTSSFRVLLAAFYVFLSRYGRTRDVVIGTPVDCRGREFATSYGNFANMVALRHALDADATPLSLARELDRVVAEAIANREVPFGEIVEQAGRSRDHSRTPVFQHSFALNRMRRCPQLTPSMLSAPPFDWEADLGSLRVGRGVALPQQEGHHDLTLWAVEHGDRVYGELKYNTDLFDARSAGQLATRIRRLFESCLRDPHRRVADLELLTEEERRRVLVDFNDTRRCWPTGEAVDVQIARMAVNDREDP